MKEAIVTGTVDYAELVGNGKRFQVPAFQRDYAWSEDQWEDLWNDIVAQEADASNSHYLGAIVLLAGENRMSSIIEGQQRMATLAVLSLAIVNRLRELAESGVDPEENRERADLLFNSFLGSKDASTLVSQSKLTLNETDRGIFNDYLLQNQTPTNLGHFPKSSRLVAGSLRYFEQQLKSFGNDGRRLAALLSEVIAHRLIFIRILVNEEMNAYNVFETLNARGIGLTTTDLLKNYLFSRMSPGDLSHLQSRWRHLINITTSEKFPEFLRFHLLCEQRKIRKAELFKRLKDRTPTAGSALNLISELEKRAETYAAIQDPAHEFWQDSALARTSIEELSLFRATAFTPLVLAAKERLDSATVAQVLRTLVVVTFRHTVIGRLATNELEVVYSDAAQAVLNGSASSAKQVFEVLKPIYVSDQKFEEDFTGFSGSNKLARYILQMVQATVGDTEALTLEHVLPQNPAPEWNQHISNSDWDILESRLGNLVLLEKPLNKTAGSLPPQAKAAAYEQSNQPAVQSLADTLRQGWTKADIDRRQREMAKVAVQKWRCDF
jgi:hypothetical protein